MLKTFVDEYELDGYYYLDYKEELTKETLECNCNFPTRVWDECDVLWYALQSIEVEVPQNREMYAVFANGSDVYSWEGAMEGLFATKEQAIEAIIKGATEDDDEAEGVMTELTENNFYMDPDMTYWNIIKISIS